MRTYTGADFRPRSSCCAVAGLSSAWEALGSIAVARARSQCSSNCREAGSFTMMLSFMGTRHELLEPSGCSSEDTGDAPTHS